MKPKTYETGRIVKSIQGRDAGRYFIVLAEAVNGIVPVADGQTHKLERPKKKKTIHLEPQPAVIDLDAARAEGGPLQDSDLRRKLEECGFSMKRSLCKEG